MAAQEPGRSQERPSSSSPSSSDADPSLSHHAMMLEHGLRPDGSGVGGGIGSGGGVSGGGRQRGEQITPYGNLPSPASPTPSSISLAVLSSQRALQAAAAGKDGRWYGPSAIGSGGGGGGGGGGGEEGFL
ncbi:unnamed protein product, partial [Laminaria digitata]